MKTVITIICFSLLSLDSFSNSPFLTSRLGLSSMAVTESLGSVSASYDSKIGMHAALGVEFCISKYFSVQSEINFINKGYKFNQSGRSLDIRLNYLEIPFLLKPKIPVGNTVEFYGELGPSLAVGVGGTGIVDGIPYTDVFGAGGFKSTDFGLNFGLGGNYFLNPQTKIGFGTRYIKGLGELYPTNSGGISGKNSGILFAIVFARSF